MNKNEMSRKFMNEYYEEKAIEAAENAKLTVNTDTHHAVAAIVATTDPLFDNWYEVACYYEPMCTKDAVQVTMLQQESNYPDINDLMDDEPMYVPNSKDRRRMRVSTRRAKTIAHKRKLGKTAEIMCDSYVKRSCEDMRNSTFCKKRGGAFVQMPKSQSMKADQIIKRAEKQHCITLEEQEITTDSTVVTDTSTVQKKQLAA